MPTTYNLQPTTSPPGFTILLAMLVITIIAATIITTTVLLQLGASRSSGTILQSTEARALADTCAEESLEQLHKLTTYTGTINLTLGNGTCTSTTTSGGGEARTIQASGSVNNITRKVSISISDIEPAMTISAWQEVADF
jgi:preprotein translocase subunit SecG